MNFQGIRQDKYSGHAAPDMSCVCTAYAGQDADRFWRMPEAYLRGNTIKYLRVPDEVGVWTGACMCQQQASAQFCVLYVLSAADSPWCACLALICTVRCWTKCRKKTSSATVGAANQEGVVILAKQVPVMRRYAQVAQPMNPTWLPCLCCAEKRPMTGGRGRGRGRSEFGGGGRGGGGRGGEGGRGEGGRGGRSGPGRGGEPLDLCRLRMSACICCA